MEGKKCIIAVDDNGQMLNLYSMVLSEKYHVVTSKSMAGVELVDCEVSLVIMDYNIVGSDFEAILDLVNTKFAGAQKILISGYLDSYILNNAKSDFNAFLEKPVTMEVLLKVVGSLIDK